MLLDQLGQKLLDKTGSSWGKKFRKQHGPIGKVCAIYSVHIYIFKYTLINNLYCIIILMKTKYY